jgi:hypothetical protein
MWNQRDLLQDPSLASIPLNATENAFKARFIWNWLERIHCWLAAFVATDLWQFGQPFPRKLSWITSFFYYHRIGWNIRKHSADTFALASNRNTLDLQLARSRGSFLYMDHKVKAEALPMSLSSNQIAPARPFKNLMESRLMENQWRYKTLNQIYHRKGFLQLEGRSHCWREKCACSSSSKEAIWSHLVRNVRLLFKSTRSNQFLKSTKECCQAETSNRNKGQDCRREAKGWSWS